MTTTALVYVPPRLPSLEGARSAIATALPELLPAAFDAIATAYPDPAITLVLPRAVRTATITDFRKVILWPTVTVAGWDITRVAANQQRGGGEWSGRLELTAFLRGQDDELLAAALDRYGAALWLALLNGQPFGGCLLEEGSESIEPSEPAGSTLHARAVLLSCTLRFRT